MEVKQFNGKHKAIKMPQGAAGEYAKYSCNFYVGCSNGCAYCYNNRWKWGDVPTLKTCFKDEKHALEIFEKELLQNLPELQKHGLFFSFTTDPMLPGGRVLTSHAMAFAVTNDVPVKILTKCTRWVGGMLYDLRNRPEFVSIMYNRKLAFGFTLTGHDELEPNASTNAERISAMKKLHEAGFKTWASIEPIIDFESSLDMILQTKDFCDLYKIGLESKKKYDVKELQNFVVKVVSEFSKLRDKNEYITRVMMNLNPYKAYDLKGKIYFKDSLLQHADINRSNLPNNCVTKDYNIFNQQS